MLAEPYGELTNTGTAELINRLARICQDEGVERVIIGMSENKMGELTKAFGEELARVILIPVEYYDETLTSQAATQKLVEGGARKKKRQTAQHQVAAALILQEYLDVRLD